MSWSRIENYKTQMSAYASSHTWSHTVSPGNNRLLVVSVAMWDSGDYVDTATYNGLTMLKAVETDILTVWKSSIWYLVAPPVGTYDVVLTFNGGDTFVLGLVAGSTTFTGINQTTPIRNTTASTLVQPAASSTDPYIDVVNCAVNDLVYGVCIRNGSLLTSVSTEDWLEYNTTDNEIGGAVYSNGTLGTVQLNWSQSGGSAEWATAGIAFIPINRRRIIIT